jgi:hypothetical protein
MPLLVGKELTLEKSSELRISVCQHHEGVLGSGAVVPHIVSLGTTWRCVVSFMTYDPVSFIPKEVAVGTKWIAGWLGILSGCFGEERTLLSRLGVKP